MKDSILKSNQSGEFKIISENGSDNVLIEFIETGYQTRTTKYNAKHGIVNDPMRPSVYGVGFMGDGPFKSSLAGKETRAYTAWHGMMERCYSESFQKENPCYSGCFVCDEWHNFQNFALFFYSNFPDDGKLYHLDKDTRFVENKEYSPEKCRIILAEINIRHGKAKIYRMKSPSGEVVTIYSMRDFCLGKDLNRNHMCAVHRGVRKSHKGWTKAD